MTRFSSLIGTTAFLCLICHLHLIGDWFKNQQPWRFGCNCVIFFSWICPDSNSGLVPEVPITSSLDQNALVLQQPGKFSRFSNLSRWRVPTYLARSYFPSILHQRPRQVFELMRGYCSVSGPKNGSSDSATLARKISPRWQRRPDGEKNARTGTSSRRLP